MAVDENPLLVDVVTTGNVFVGKPVSNVLFHAGALRGSVTMDVQISSLLVMRRKIGPKKCVKQVESHQGLLLIFKWF